MSLPRDPEKIREWQQRCARRHEARLRAEHDYPVGRIGPNRERRERERERAYGPPERREWIRAMGCLVCGALAENAHVKGGGVARKSDARWVVPLCRGHHQTGDDSLHRLGSVERFRETHGIDLHAEARRIDSRWRTYIADEHTEPEGAERR